MAKEETKKQKCILIAIILLVVVLFIFFSSIILNAQEKKTFPNYLYPANPTNTPTYIELRMEYAEWCAETVKDTLTEYGTVDIKIKIIGDELKVVSRDTIWSKEKCPEYKYQGAIYLGDYISSGNLSDISINASSYTTSNNYYYLQEPSSNLITKKETIKREKVCDCKLMKPTSQGFWEWVEDNYIENKKGAD